MFEPTRVHVNRQKLSWLTRVSALGRELADAAMWGLAPARCLLCDASCGPSGAVQPMDMCLHCQRLMPLDGFEWPDNWGPIARIYCPWRYEYPLDAMIKALKFRGERAYGRLLGGLLAEQLRRSDAQAECVVPMPLHRQRLRARGFNQAAEIAQFAGAALRLPLARQALLRQRLTLPQSALSLQARLQNPRGAFVANGAVRGRQVALIDDVVTTGSTAIAAATALRQAGAARVELWALARVVRGPSAGC